MKTHNFQITNADTDSISFCKPDQSEWSKKEQDKLLAEINKYTENGVFWDHDGVMEKFIIVAAKNYIMCTREDGGELKVKIKGSGLKATKKEPRLKQFMKDVIQYIVDDKLDKIDSLYMECAADILKIDKDTDLRQYAFKATVTKKVIDPGTPFNTKIRDAMLDAGRYLTEGDKQYLIFKNDKSLALYDVISHTDIDTMTLLRKLFDTMKTFRKILPMDKYPNLTLKRNQKRLELLKSFI